MKICVMGLGYVGLPLACLCAKKGHEVCGIDLNKEIVEKTNRGISHVADEKLNRELKELKGKITATTDGSDELKKSDVAIICVPTPVDKQHRPDLGAVESACEKISKNLRKGCLVILESTVYPGTTEEKVLPILEKSDLRAGRDFYLAHCPERIDPGNKKWTIENIPRVVGGVDKPSAEKAKKFYESILSSEVLELNSLKAAEATKIMENAFRDVNISFINEMAKSFDIVGIDILEVIKAASTKPFAFMPHYPGIGVGGHCIPVDPYYMIEKAKEMGFEHKFLSLAREINNSMPLYTVELFESALKKIGKPIAGASVGVLGVAYKADVGDVRESPALRLIDALKEKGAKVFVYDPYVAEKSNVGSLDELLKKSDYIILATAHTQFKEMDVNKLKSSGIKIVIDGRNCLKKKKIQKLGIIYKGIGH